MTDDTVTIGPIEHGPSLCEWQEPCQCWCRACEQHNRGAAQAEARVAHLLVCRCPERPRCRPHHDDGVHQWLDLCDLPHEHGEPVVSRAALTPPASEPRNVVPHPAHVPEGSRTHVISWSNVGRHCNVPDCEVNRSGEREGGHG